ncbi:MarR family winged helix-turn-helix transcriptional regulator [Actinomyces massiliensis]|uniref:MarR family protein n=1 Tax=Actinomyces massiliensis F0489 TaxID=1125718 RepID=J0NQX7_9ACTO|nr:MarR family transcriptional regulator [Actinomyces massiliensis]EJF47212.1 MarR family protein [Actinomyces massiliensis F0489]WLD70676.1 MarR family transcriptional regulator [Actinomyces massiliensis]
MKSDAEKAQRIGDVSLRLGNGIKRVEHLLMGEKARALRDFELTVPQYATLATLAQSPGQSAAQLARAALVSPQTMATILSNLEAKGLIARDVSSLHTRVLVCRLTESGEGLVSKADESVRAIEDDLRSAFTDDEFSQFHEYLARSEKRILARKIS